MERHTWWWYHTLGWWVWVVATPLLAIGLAWSRRDETKRVFVPWLFLALFLGSAGAHYFRSDWGHYTYSRMIWLSGVGSIVAVSLLPLAVCLVAEASLRPLVKAPSLRAAIAAACGVAVVFLAQTWVAFHVAGWITNSMR